MNIAAWIVFGLMVGVIANLIDPRPAQGGMIGAVVLGMLGALLGGFLGNIIFGVGITDFSLSSFIVAVVGSLILLSLGRIFQTRSL